MTLTQEAYPAAAKDPGLALCVKPGSVLQDSCQKLLTDSYSLLSAATGSCFAAFREGMNPPMNVSRMQSRIRTVLAPAGRKARMPS